MAIQLSEACRNARLDAFETFVGTSPVLKIRTGAQPGAVADADSGTALMSITLSADWAAAASGGTKSFTDLPGSFAASVSGIAGHFRLYKSDGTTCVMQGSVSLVGNGGNLTVSNDSMTSGFSYTVNAFAIGDGNA
jgi:hypothetical protein